MKQNNKKEEPSAPPDEAVPIKNKGETEGYTENLPLQPNTKSKEISDDIDNDDDYIPPPAYNPEQATIYSLPENVQSDTMPVITTTPKINTEGQPLKDPNAAPAAQSNDASSAAAGQVVIVPIDNNNNNNNDNSNIGYPANIGQAGIGRNSRNAKYSQLPRVHQEAPIVNGAHGAQGGAAGVTRLGRSDDPTCLYIFAIAALFLPLIGIVGICVYNCGNGLGPRQTSAFRLLIICTLISILITVVASSG